MMNIYLLVRLSFCKPNKVNALNVFQTSDIFPFLKAIPFKFSFPKKILLTLLLFTSLHFNVSSQWNNLNTGINDDLTGVVFWGNNGAVSSNKGLYYTTNGGVDSSSWIRFNISGNINDSILYNNSQFHHCFAFNLSTSINTVYACGQDTVNNKAILMKFNFPSMTYSIVYEGLPNSNLQNIGYSQFDNKYYAVGDSGLVISFTSTSIGTRLPNNITQNFNSVSFYDDRFSILSNDYQMFGINDGTSLQFISIPSSGMNLKDTYCKTAGFFYHTGDSFIETNYGNIIESWSFDFGSLNGQCISYKNSLFYIGTDHGIFKQVYSNYKLEWQPSSGTESINEFWFEASNPNIFYACGENGVLLKTTNDGGPSKPYATISAVGACVGIGNIWTNGNAGSGGSCMWTVDGIAAGTSCMNFNHSTNIAGSFAISLITGSGGYSDTAYATLNIVNPPQFNLNYSISDDTLCKEESIEITLQNTEPNVYYSLIKFGESNALGNSATSVGGTLTFQTNLINSSGNFHLRATSSLANCYRDFTDTIQIVVEKTKANLHVGLINAEVNENAPFYEQTKDAQNFLWTFTNQSDTITSSLSDPLIPFSNVGNTNVNLICFSNAGCYDSIQKEGPNIINTIGEPNRCWTNQNRAEDLSWNGHYTPDISDMIPTRDGYYTVGQYSNVSFNSQFGDSLINPNAGAYINKYDHKGILKWSIKSELLFDDMDVTFDRDCFYKIKEDNQRNIIVSGFVNTFVDNGGDTIKIPSYNKNVIIKIDSLGKVIWKFSLSGGIKSIETFGIDNDNNIVFNCWKQDDWEVLTTMLIIYPSQIILNTLALSNAQTNGGLIKISSAGFLIWDIALEMAGPNYKEIINIGFDISNNIYFSGNVENNFIFYDVNNPAPTFVAPFGTAYTTNPFIFKYSPGGNRQWLSYAHGPDYTDIIMNKAVTTPNGVTYFTGNNQWTLSSQAFVYMNPDSSTVTDSGMTYFVTKIGQNGYCNWINSMNFTGTQSLTGSGCEIFVENNEVHVLNEFFVDSLYLTFTGENGEQITVPGYRGNFCVNIYDTSGVIKKSLLNNPSSSNVSLLRGFNGLFKDLEGYYYTSRNIENLASTLYHEFGDSVVPSVGRDGWVTRFHEECGYVYFPSYNVNQQINECHSINLTLPNGEELLNIDTDTIFSYYGTTVNGMDSIVNYYIQINQIVSQLSDTVCYGSNYTFLDGTTINSVISTIAHSTLFNTFEGCDSIINTIVSPFSINTNISNSNGILQSDEISATYQWLDCNNNFAPILGETNIQFIPIINGSYAVELNSNNCSVITNCINISSLSILNIQDKKEIQIYPNPTYGFVTIAFENIQNNVELKLIDISGKVILNQHKSSANKLELIITSTPGIYFLEIKDDLYEVHHFKVIKK